MAALAPRVPGAARAHDPGTQSHPVAMGGGAASIMKSAGNLASEHVEVHRSMMCRGVSETFRYLPSLQMSTDSEHNDGATRSRSVPYSSVILLPPRSLQARV